MGLYIKGMEMPTKGEYHMTLYVCGDGAAYVDVAELPADEDRFAAVPVPPHGRLVDADRAARQIRRWSDDITFAPSVIAGWLTNGDFEAIIPAEEGKT